MTRTGTTDTSRVNRWVGAICAGAMMVVYILYYWLLAPTNLTTDAANLRDVRHLVLWGSASLVLSVVILWCMGISAIVIRRYHRQLDRREWRIVLLVALAVTTVMLLILWYSAGFVVSEASDVLLKPLFKAKHPVKLVVTSSNGLGIPMVIGLLLATVLVSRRVGSSTAAELGERIRWFRTLLYSAGAFLATLIYEVFRLYQWGADLAACGQAMVGAELTGLGSSLTLAHGLIFSSFMALIFLPTAIQLDHREDTLVSSAAAADAKFDREHWAMVNRIEGSPLTALGSYVAVLLPTLTAVFTKALESWVHT
jgi:hypothetical protein